MCKCRVESQRYYFWYYIWLIYYTFVLYQYPNGVYILLFLKNLQYLRTSENNAQCFHDNKLTIFTANNPHVQQRTGRFVLLYTCKNLEVDFLVCISVEPVNKSCAESAATSKNHTSLAWKSTHDSFNKNVPRHLVTCFFLFILFLLFVGIPGTRTKNHRNDWAHRKEKNGKYIRNRK